MPISTYTTEPQVKHLVPKEEFFQAVRDYLNKKYGDNHTHDKMLDIDSNAPWHIYTSIPNMGDMNVVMLADLYGRVDAYEYSTGFECADWDNFLVAVVMNHPVRQFVIR